MYLVLAAFDPFSFLFLDAYIELIFYSILTECNLHLLVLVTLKMKWARTTK